MVGIQNESREEMLGIELPDTLRSMKLLAEVSWPTGKVEAGMRLSEQVALEIRKRALGVGHRDTLQYRNDLAKAHEKFGRVIRGRKRIDKRKIEAPMEGT